MSEHLGQNWKLRAWAAEKAGDVAVVLPAAAVAAGYAWNYAPLTFPCHPSPLRHFFAIDWHGAHVVFLQLLAVLADVQRPGTVPGAAQMPEVVARVPAVAVAVGAVAAEPLEQKLLRMGQADREAEALVERPSVIWIALA